MRENRNNQSHNTLSLRNVFQLLNKRDKKFLSGSIFIQVILTFLDLMAISLITFLVAISTGTNNRITSYVQNISFLDVSKMSKISIFQWTLIIVVILFVSKTVLNASITFRILKRMSLKSADLTRELLLATLSRNLTHIKGLNFQTYIFNLSRGLEIICLQILAPIALLIADLLTTLIMIILLFYISPGTSLGVVLLFVSAAVILHRYQNTRSQKTAKYAVELEIKANNKVSEMLLAFREMRVRGSKLYFSQEVYNIKLDWARYISRLYFYPSITKFSYEGIILLSAVIIALFQVMDTSASSSISTTAIFVAVGFRIAPIALRSQQNYLQIKSNLGTGYSTIEMINSLRNETDDSDEGEIDTETPEVFEARVDVRDLSLREPGSNLILQDVNLEIFAGEKVAIAGASGSGKTSLIEVILGLTPVSTGSVLISGVSPESSFVKFPGSIAYVPQNIFISSGTIRDNLAFGFKTEDFSEEDYWHCLRMVKLDLFVNSLPLKLDSQVGEFGSSLSGGERQRLAIARALIVHPKLLVIDEGTSALDLITESELSKEILEIGSEVTVIMVAHRISAMRDFNRIIFLQNGTIAGKGNFSELYKTLPQFADTVNKNL